MDYRWRYADAEGREVAGPTEAFTDQVGAEEWFSAQWQELAEDGVHQVTLLCGEAEVYGPMSLHPAGS